MSRVLALAVAVVAASLSAAACSSTAETGGGSDAPVSAADSGAIAPSTKDAGSSSTTPTPGPASTTDGAVSDGSAANCVPKGYAGNDKKIGAYCDDSTSCPFQIDPFLICTAGHDETGNHLFCTTPCSKDSECGSNAYCVHYPAGAGCVPTQCGGAPGL